jgi:sugar phosphate permease
MIDMHILSPMKHFTPDEHKWRTFLLTFISYSGLHIMRMSYSHSKPNLKASFHQSNLTLGIFDALTYTFLGIGFFFRFLLQDQKQLTKSFLTLITFGCIGYSCLPLISIVLGEKIL